MCSTDAAWDDETQQSHGYVIQKGWGLPSTVVLYISGALATNILFLSASTEADYKRITKHSIPTPNPSWDSKIPQINGILSFWEMQEKKSTPPMALLEVIKKCDQYPNSLPQSETCLKCYQYLFSPESSKGTAWSPPQLSSWVQHWLEEGHTTTFKAGKLPFGPTAYHSPGGLHQSGGTEVK